MLASRSNRWSLALAVAAGMVVLIVAAIVATRAPLAYDEAVYLGIAREIEAGGCPVRPEGPGALYMNNPPLVTMVAAVARHLGAVEVGGMRAVQQMIWTLGLVLGVGLAAWRGFGPRAAAIALLALLTLDELMISAARVELDVPLAAVTAGFVAVVLPWAMAPSERRGRPWLALVLAAAAVLVRYQGVFVGPCGALALVVLARRRGEPWSRALVGPAAWCAGGTALGALGWIALARACGGELSAVLAHNLDRIASGTAEPWFHRPLPAYLASLAGWIGPMVGVGAIVVLVIHRRTLLDRPVVLLCGATIAVTLAFCSIIELKAERYFAPALALLAVLAGGLATLRDRAARVWPLLGVGVVLAALVSIAGIIAGLPAKPGLDAYYARVGRVVAEHTQPDERVLLPHVQVAWFADRHYRVSVFERDPDVILRWLSDPAERITIVALDDRLLAFHPEMPEHDQARLRRFLEKNFERIAVDEPHALLWRRR